MRFKYNIIQRHSGRMRCTWPAEEKTFANHSGQADKVEILAVPPGFLARVTDTGIFLKKKSGEL